MTNQKLFEALERVCGFTALQSDMFEIIRAVEADKMPMTETIEPNKYKSMFSVRCLKKHDDGLTYGKIYSVVKETEKYYDIFPDDFGHLSGFDKRYFEPRSETIEQAAERHRLGDPYNNFIRGATWQSSQPNPHRIKVAHVHKLLMMYDASQITFSRMVEILNEIAAGKHKERIEL
jgi:hypothetical protein